MNGAAARVGLAELAHRHCFINGRRCAKVDGCNEFIMFIIYNVGCVMHDLNREEHSYKMT